jgi:hypothetical protein
VLFGNPVLSRYRTKDTETSEDLGIIQTPDYTEECIKSTDEDPKLFPGRQLASP